jgi:uncharacterized protein (DUF2336 family)
MTFVSAEFISELEDAVAGAPERRVPILGRVTDLLLANAGRLDQPQIGVFDDVLVRLMRSVDARSLAKLSMALSDLPTAPRETVCRLARHEEAVAVPVLLKTESLADEELIEIASKHSRQHLLAIAERRTLNEAVIDALLERGDTTVCRALAKNAGARFSEQAYAKLIATAGRDDDTADALVLRPDLPIKMLHKLLSGSTKVALAQLLSIARPETREVIQATIERFATQDTTKTPAAIDYSEAKSKVLALSKTGKLSDSAVNRFAVHRECENLVAALSLLATVAIETIEPLMEESDGYGLMVTCRASRLNWQTTVAVISNRSCARRFGGQELEQLKAAYEALCLSVAQRTIRFGTARDCVSAMTQHFAEDSAAIAEAG